MMWIDLPPIWTAVFVGIAWRLRGTGPQLEGAVWDGLGLMLIGLALALMLWAVAAMRAARTTVLPHRMPNALITGGPFALSRNPIYLGDVFLLKGVVMWMGPVLALALVPALMAILRTRFILPEEARLRAAFGPSFEAWCDRTRRWI